MTATTDDVDQFGRMLYLLQQRGKVTRSNGGYAAGCPAHADDGRSLTVSRGSDGPEFSCRAGCAPAAIVAALGAPVTGPGAARQSGNGHTPEWTPSGPARAVYRYRDEAGQHLYDVLVTDGGRVRQRAPDDGCKGGWRWNLGATRRVLYRLPEILEAVAAGEVIWVTGREEDAETLAAQGLHATCNQGGPGRWRPEFAEVLRDAIVMIVADADKEGRKHARQVMASLRGVAGAAEIYESPHAHNVTAHLADGHPLADLECTVRDEDYAADLAQDLYEFIGEPDPPDQWVLPGLLERGDRLIFTGREGLGKTVEWRTFGVAAAAGIHPFTDEVFRAARVLVIDCENSRKKSRRWFRKLEAVARAKGRPVPPGGLRIIHRPEGVDLSQEDEQAWLFERVTAHRPDLLLIGPLYKWHMLDITEELAARQITNVLDRVLALHDCAMMIEAHPPKGTDKLEPYGSSLFLRWPDSGKGIIAGGKCPVHGRNDGHSVVVEQWRGDREERTWPQRLVYGDGWYPGALDANPSQWPWVVADEDLRPDAPPPQSAADVLFDKEEAKRRTNDELAARRAKARK
jgi:hypothetical protein